MPQHMRGDVEVLIWGQMGVGLLGDALQDEEGLRPVQPLAAPGRKQGSRHVAPLLQPRIEHVPVLFLDGDKALHMASLAEHVDKPPLIILVDVDGEQFTDPESGPQEGRDERMVSQPLIRPAPCAHAQRLRGVE
jgi:hypothetical protein